MSTAADRVEAFLDVRENMTGLDPDNLAGAEGVMLHASDLRALVEQARQVQPEVPKYERHVSVDDDLIDASLTLTLWRDAAVGSRQVVRIAVEDIPDLMDAVVRHGVRALSNAAHRIEVGHCETCGNSGLVDVEKNRRTSRVICPDCQHRWPDAPFANAPRIGRRGEQA